MCSRHLKMGLEAATKALLDAGITYDEVETAFVGYCYGELHNVCKLRNYLIWGLIGDSTSV